MTWPAWSTTRRCPTSTASTWSPALVDRAFTFAMAHDDDRMNEPDDPRLRACSDLVPNPRRAGVRTADVTVTMRDEDLAAALRRSGARDRRRPDRRRGDREGRRPCGAGARARGHRGHWLARLWSVDACDDVTELTALLGAPVPVKGGAMIDLAELAAEAWPSPTH